VTEKIDANRGVMIKAIRDFGESLKEGDIVIIYYSGHGLSYDGFHCLLPNDYEGDESTIKEFSVDFTVLMRLITKKNPSYKLFLFECCRNRLFENIITMGDQPTTFSGLSSSKFGNNILIASSTAESTTASGNGKNNMSLWTSYLVEELDVNGPVNIVDCFMNVRYKMSQNHTQTPWENSSLMRHLYL